MMTESEIHAMLLGHSNSVLINALWYVTSAMDGYDFPLADITDRSVENKNKNKRF